jgi:hypothetical protein
VSKRRVERLNAAARRAVRAPISRVLVGRGAKGPVEQENIEGVEGGVKVPIVGKVRRGGEGEVLGEGGS